jgi:hypothetical protein
MVIESCSMVILCTLLPVAGACCSYINSQRSKLPYLALAYQCCSTILYLPVGGIQLLYQHVGGIRYRYCSSFPSLLGVGMVLPLPLTYL